MSTRHSHPSRSEVRERKQLYFPNLNGLRFFAALIVFVGHVEWMLKVHGLPNHADIPFVMNSGSLGVTLFFVLSGFLITYLLLEERSWFGRIDIKKFYIRRILRIWPLYLLAVGLAFFVLPFIVGLPGMPSPFEPGQKGWVKLTLFITMLPNVSYVALPLVPFASQLWSVGVEEQFYLVWPHLVRRLRSRALWTLCGVAVAIVTLRLAVDLLAGSGAFPRAHVVGRLLHYLRIPCMALGGIMAFGVIEDRAFIARWVFPRAVQITALALAILCQIIGVNLGFLEHELFAVFYAVIVANCATNPSSIVNLEFPSLDYLGRVSYGLYVYQILGIKLGLELARLTMGDSSVWLGGATYVLGGALTLLMSAVSYRYYESRALTLKDRFSLVTSNRRDSTARGLTGGRG